MREFFNKPTTLSKVKIEIVSKYFHMWSSVFKKRPDNFAYIDLFAGPGYYDDGTPSIPIRVLENAIDDNEKRNKLISLFNDADKKTYKRLSENISKINGVQKLKFQPKVENENVDKSLEKQFKETKLIPTLLFIDPWGYKGFTIGLVGSVLKDWGCDCIFFFNYNRINAAIDNSSFEDGSVQEIFGKSNTEELKSQLTGKKPGEREKITLDFVRERLKTKKGEYTFAMRFKKENSSKTSHYLILTSKHPLAHSFIKEISFKYSTGYLPKMDAFEFDPKQSKQLQLFEIANPQDLAKKLLSNYIGKEIKLKDLYQKDHMGTPYLKNHYKKALLYLEKTGKVEIVEDGKKRRKDTLGDDKVVIFKG